MIMLDSFNREDSFIQLGKLLFANITQSAVSEIHVGLLSCMKPGVFIQTTFGHVMS